MTDYIISGIQQIGIGVEDFHEAWKYYIEIFNMDIKILEDDTIAAKMLPYTGNQAHKRHAAIAINMQGGAGFEIWQYSERKPEKIKFEIAFGDLGINAAKIKSRNVEKTYNELAKNSKVNIISKISNTIDNKPCFFIKDPYNNVFQIVEDKYIFRDEKKLTGGAVGAIIGLSDIDKSLHVYRDILGYDKILADERGIFEDIATLNGGTEKYRRLLLTHSKERKGSFSKLFGQSYIELVQPLERKPRKIYENRFWGDPGFIQICFDVRNMDILKEKCKQLGQPFTVDSKAEKEDKSFDMGEAAGRFAYIEDADGNLIEFVETHKIPLMKKLGISINLMKRDPLKPLPNILLKAMRLRRVKSEDVK